MNFQQLSNLQYWTSLFSSPWSIVTNLIDILIVTYILYHFTKAIAGTKIMILVRRSEERRVGKSVYRQV